MKDWQDLAHVKWECKYHLVIVPKYRRQVLFGRSRRQVGTILRQLCRQKGVDLLDGHAMPDHIHLVLSIPPKYSVAMVVGYLKRPFSSIPELRGRLSGPQLLLPGSLETRTGADGVGVRR